MVFDVAAEVLANTRLSGDYNIVSLAASEIARAAGSQQLIAGQVADPEELGGAEMHSAISGTVDYHEANDESCIQRLRSLACQSDNGSTTQLATT